MEPEHSELRRPAPPRPTWAERCRAAPRAAVGRTVGWVRWIGPARLAVGCLSAGGAVLVGWWLVAAPPTPVEDTLPRASAATTDGGGEVSPDSGASAAPIPTANASVTVHVTGAVGVPGVYTLPAGSRVIDAVALAGGATPSADVSAINLAAVLVDGQKVVVPLPGEVIVAPEASPATSSGGPVSLSQASAEALDGLPGIGPVLADAIVRWRTEHGGFGSVDEITEVPGIGPALLERLRGLVVP